MLLQHLVNPDEAILHQVELEHDQPLRGVEVLALAVVDVGLVVGHAAERPLVDLLGVVQLHPREVGERLAAALRRQLLGEDDLEVLADRVEARCQCHQPRTLR